MKKKTFKRTILLSLTIVAVIGFSSVAYILSLYMNGPEPNNSINNHTNGENNHHTDIKIVGKVIPPGYVMGNPLDIRLYSGMNVFRLDEPLKKVAIRFTAKLSGEATTLTINAFAITGEPQVRVGLQSDNGGEPTGDWISLEAFGVSNVPATRDFVTVELHEVVFISKGSIYHIVIESLVENSVAAIVTYEANGLAQPLDDEDPDIVWPDPVINSLFYDGKTWQQEEKWPIFVIGYSDGNSEGQPYSLAAPWVIHGPLHVGQTLVPASNYSIGKIAFVVSLKGTPKDNLFYEIRDAGENILAQGLFATVTQLSTRRTWIEITLPSPITFNAGKLYRVVLTSPGTDLDNPYHLYGHEFAYDPRLGYGGLQHTLTKSPNIEVAWFENEDADAIFKLTQIES